MAAFLPDLHNLLGLAGVAAALALFLLLGAMTTAAGTFPEIQIVAGWGLTCLVLTAWTVLTPATAKIPLTGLALVALLGLARKRWRDRIGSLAGVGRLLLLSLPMWLVLLPLRPAEIDTWLNLLPNAAYLYDHGMLPTDARPPSHSFLPAAPYNTQFVAYIASVVSGSFADAAMALFNVALLCASGLLLARVIAGRGAALSWPACAMGLLLAIPLNPGFVPRVFFASYGEATLAVATMFAVWIAIDVVADLARGTVWPRATTALALILAALVNIKQSGVGELLSVGLPLLAVALVHPRIPVRRGLVVGAAALLPALLLALAWRVFVEQAFVGGELKPLPFAAWNFSLLPTILGAMLRIAVQKATLFVLIAAALGVAVWQCRRDPWSRRGLLFMLTAGVVVLFNGFLVVTYVVHFPAGMAADAHSYFRYASQLSLVVILALTVAARPFAAYWLTKVPARARYAGAAAIVLVLAIPPAIAGMLRYDLGQPQPLLWDLGHRAAAEIHPGDRLALLVPGDVYDSVGSMLRGVILFTAPRRPGLDIQTRTEADPGTLEAAASAGYTLALISCTPAGLDGVPPGVAALLRHVGDGWRLVQAWPYPADIAHWRFAALLARAPLCAVQPPH
jgi:hypothetical protein